MTYYSVEVLGEERVFAIAIEESYLSNSISEEESVCNYIANEVEDLQAEIQFPDSIIVDEIDKEDYYDFPRNERY